MRYCPRRPFPPYAFLPGRDPHPTRDPHGHSFRHEEAPPPRVEPRRWSASEAYLFGVDLYNHGFLWEAHESWEGLWHVSKPDRIQALYLQGLIQCAAAWLKIPMGQPAGVQRLSTLALEKLDEVERTSGERYMGLDLARFRPAVRAFAASGAVDIEARPRLELESDAR
ncbi:MAG: DUF309 domain-containing protein [Planctomycetota bacterium]